jgi:ABC-2 type transport system ATP-binding protein
VSVAIEIENVGKRFRLYREKSDSLKEKFVNIGRNDHEEFWALRDIDFTVQEGEMVGLLGHNGSGKSTLLKCIAGILRPTTGSIRTAGRIAALLELGSGMHPELTGRENVFLNGSILGLSRREVVKRFDDIVAFAEIDEFIDNQVKHYSSGMAARLGFAVAVNVEPNILLVDEVLAVGDEAFQRKCRDRIKRFQREGRTILVVTHNPDLVRQMCDRAVVLDRGELVTVGPPAEGVLAYRDALMRRGVVLADVENEHILTNAVKITDVRVEYVGNPTEHAVSGEPVRVVMSYEAEEPVDDIVFAINIYDRQGNLLLGTNSEVLDFEPGPAVGYGEIAFDLGRVPLLDGVYEVHLGLHSSDGGVEYDHRAGKDFIEVLNPGRSLGLVDFEPQIVRLRDSSRKIS